MSLWDRMRAREAASGSAPIAVVGAGWVGRGLVRQLLLTPGMHPAVIANRTPATAVRAFVEAGVPADSVLVSDDLDAVAAAIADRRPVVTGDARLLAGQAGLAAVVETTGSIDHGATVMLDCLAAGLPVVSINAEVDATVGQLLHATAKTAGTVYTICDGDQPGVLLRQLDDVRAMGFEVIAAINCKRHLDIRQTPESSAPYAARDGTSAAVTTAAGDGTKMQIECAVVANAWGLPPERRGMTGIPTTLADAVGAIVPRLSRPGVVDYTLGGDFGAGVFVIGRAPEPAAIQQAMRFFKMGDGPDYLFFRPYHLVQLEMPFTIAEVLLDGTGLGGHDARPPVAEVVAVAKRDLAAGEQLDGIGGNACYGEIDTVAGASGLLPMAFTEHARLTRAVRCDDVIPLDAVELTDAPIVGLRARQDQLAGAAP